MGLSTLMRNASLLLCCVTLLKAATLPVQPTEGEPWPKPQKMVCQKTNFTVSGTSFKFVIDPLGEDNDNSNGSCEILNKAVARYKKYLFGQSAEGHSSVDLDDVDGNSTILKGLEISVVGSCEKWPYFGMNEQYTLSTSDSSGMAKLSAASVWGALRGLETFSHLFMHRDNNVLEVRQCQISDWPRFLHRGILLDTSRHYLSEKKIIENLELMAQNKYNVFHWHIVDDQSFPFVSETYPELSGKGAYSPLHVYSPAAVQRILNAAREMGIRVVPEFDTPGHTTSWGAGIEGLITDCYNSSGMKTGRRALLDPSKMNTYDVVLALFTEVLRVFPDKFVHLGGDEVRFDFKCWTYNPRVKEFMDQQGFQTPEQLENFYFKQLLPLIERARAGTDYIVWQEVLDNEIHVRGSTIAHVWKGNNQAERAKELSSVTGQGYRALLSSCWYLNYIHYGDDWSPYYSCDPQDFNGTASQKALVMGGEACMWGEFVDDTNVTPRLWPRASIVAERLWSAQTVTDTADAQHRVAEHRCRLVRRGYPVEPPTGPSFCPIEWPGDQ